MLIKRVSIGDMFGWIGKTFSLVLAHPGTMAGAAILMLLAVLAMSLPAFLMLGSVMSFEPGAQPDFMQIWPRFLAAYGLVMLLNLALMPPLLMGWMRMARDLDQGRATGATAIFQPFSDRPAWISGIGLLLLTLVLMVVLVLVMLALFWIPGSAFFAQAAQAEAARAAGLAAPGMGFPFFLIAAYLLFILVAGLVQFASLLGFVELALRGGSAFDALVAGLKSVLRNAPGLLLWILVVGITTFVLVLVVAIILSMVMLAVAALAPAAAMVVSLLLYVPLALAIYPLMHAGTYIAWKDMLGSDAAGPEHEGGAVAV